MRAERPLRPFLRFNPISDFIHTIQSMVCIQCRDRDRFAPYFLPLCALCGWLCHSEKTVNSKWERMVSAHTPVIRLPLTYRQIRLDWIIMMHRYSHLLLNHNHPRSIVIIILLSPPSRFSCPHKAIDQCNYDLITLNFVFHSSFMHCYMYL